MQKKLYGDWQYLKGPEHGKDVYKDSAHMIASPCCIACSEVQIQPVYI